MEFRADARALTHISARFKAGSNVGLSDGSFNLLLNISFATRTKEFTAIANKCVPRARGRETRTASGEDILEQINNLANARKTHHDKITQAPQTGRTNFGVNSETLLTDT